MADIMLPKVALGAWAWGNNCAFGGGIDAIRFWERSWTKEGAKCR